MTKIGVIGSKGRVGQILAANGATSIDVDITDRMSLRTAGLDDYDVIINCAGVTDVDACEHPAHIQTDAYKLAAAVNTRGPENIRASFSGRLIHLSTDYVFKGDKGPYIENDKCDPVNDYGYTKWGGEIVLGNYWVDLETVIVRTTGLYGSDHDFAAYVVRCLRSGEQVLASSELRGNQTYIPHLAEALFYLANMHHMPDVVTYVHVGSKEVVSRFEFGVEVAIAFGLPSWMVCPCHNTQIAKWVAPRPTRGGLIVSKAEKMGIPLYTIAEGLEAYRGKI